MDAGSPAPSPDRPQRVAPTRRRALVLISAGALTAAVGGAGLAADPQVRRRARAAVEGLHPGPHVTPTATAGRRERGAFTSRACGRTVHWQLALPPAAGPDTAPAVAVVLHGRGGDAATAFTGLSLDGFLADAVAAGTPPVALASVDGGDHTYWHRRASGEDPQTMVVEEFLPMLAARGLATSRFALFGWSMGGYGALLLAEVLGAALVVAVAADSPALWQRAADTAPGAFDDAADFTAHDVFTRRRALAGVPVRLACGDADPFYDATRAFAAGVPDLAGTVYGAGGHDRDFWRATAPGQLRFLGAALHP